MKAKINFRLVFAGIFLLNMPLFAQVESKQVTKSKEVIMKTQNLDTLQVCFIDKFFVPQNSIDEFKQKMNVNRNFVSKLSGYVKGEAFEQKDNDGNLTIITIAVWENQEHLDKAKNLMQSEFKNSNFNPTEFYQRLNVKLERGLYQKINE